MLVGKSLPERVEHHRPNRHLQAELNTAGFFFLAHCPPQNKSLRREKGRPEIPCSSRGLNSHVVSRSNLRRMRLTGKKRAATALPGAAAPITQTSKPLSGLPNEKSKHCSCSSPSPPTEAPRDVTLTGTAGAVTHARVISVPSERTEVWHTHQPTQHAGSCLAGQPRTCRAPAESPRAQG